LGSPTQKKKKTSLGKGPKKSREEWGEKKMFRDLDEKNISRKIRSPSGVKTGEKHEEIRS